MQSPVRLKLYLIVAFFLGGSFLFLPQTVGAASGPYCLCEWNNPLDQTKSINGNTKYTCLGAEEKNLVQEGSWFGYITNATLADKIYSQVLLEDPKSGNGLVCDSVVQYVVSKKVVSVTGLSCNTYPDKNACTAAREKKLTEAGAEQEACFCSSDDGTTKAKCVPDDQKECASYITSEFTMCELRPSNYCLQGVGAAVQSEMTGLPVSDGFGIPKMAKVLNKLGTSNVKTILGRVIQTAMGVIGSIALVMFIYGGILFMTARGDSEHYEKGTNILLWSSLGVVVIFSSYALLKFVFEIFT